MEPDFVVKTLDTNAKLCLARLETGLVGNGLSCSTKNRGHFGNVRRFSIDQATRFDALPARGWILLYFSPAASRRVGLQFADVKKVFDHAVERSDLIVKVRLHNEHEAELMIEMIRSAIEPFAKRS